MTLVPLAERPSMKVAVCGGAGQLSHTTRRLLQGTFAPLCGLSQRVSFLLRSRDDPRFAVAGGELTGVHLLRDPTSEATPSPLDYHIGGCGVRLDEAYIRVVGETVERYCQLVAQAAGRYPVTVASRQAMARGADPVLAEEGMRFYAEAQFEAEGFPFAPFDAARPLGWVRVPSLVGDHHLRLPAQLLLVGYAIDRAAGEPWLNTAVSTGTATHVAPELALRSALLELIQIDSAMGHWYGASRARRIAADARTAAIDRLVARRFGEREARPEFYWLPNADLPAMTVACVVKPRHGTPAVGVGMGSGRRLSEAMYKALLEGVAVVQLAKIILAYTVAGGEGEAQDAGDPGAIADFNSNVAFYARPGNLGAIEDKFDAASAVEASRLPPDHDGDPRDDIRAMVEAFRDGGKELVFMDLTTSDVRRLGLWTFRVWSPDLLGLSLPSFPPLEHPRFEAYGGCAHGRPHPYP